MKVVVSVCAFAAVVLLVSAAPTLNEDVVSQQPEDALNSQQPQFVREKRSQYPAYGGYSAPCGGAAVATLPAVAPIPAVAPASYQVNLGPVHAGYGYPAPHSYGYGAPHYRSDEFGNDQETFFPDMDHMMSDHVPMARYGGYGGYGPAGHVGGMSGMSGIAGLGQLAPAAAGPAFGVFPNANVGGCNVPLLLSCSPSIIPGRLVKSQGYGGYGAPAAGPVNAYRGVDDSQPEHEDHHEEMENHEHLSATNDSHPTSTHQ